MPPFISTFSFWFALVLSFGSLLFYLSGSIWNRLANIELSSDRRDFNLGLPNIGKSENLFAISLVAAGTSLSTVFVFFLTAGTIYGWWLFLSPIMFAIGNVIMFKVYKRVEELKYFETAEDSLFLFTGLVPFLGQRFTNSKIIGWMLLFLSLINLIAVLVLELVVGVEVFGYLAKNAFHAQSSSWIEFVIFLVSILLLLGYVFIGGFRAVVFSDVWQMKAMKSAIVLTIFSLIIYLFTSVNTSININVFSKSPPLPILCGFVLNVILANIFAPLSQESSWQRFRAFAQFKDINFTKAMKLSITNSLALWIGLIAIVFFLLLAISTRPSFSLSSMANVLESLRTLNNWWFPLFIFPIMTVAALSAMYSTADTCVSSLLYLIEYSVFTKFSDSTVANKRGKLSASYYIAMALIFLASLSVYVFVRVRFNPTILQLVFSVFSNLVIISPTVISAAILAPYDEGKVKDKNRSTFVFISLCLGFLFYWGASLTAIVKGQDYLWLSQLSIVLGLIGSIIPILPLWLNNNKEGANA